MSAVYGTGNRSSEIAHLGSPLREQRQLADGRAVADLSSMSILTLTGPDALSWLNSITTQKLDTAQPGTSTETLVLSPTGHIEHWAYVYVADDRVWLIVDGDGTPLREFLESMKFMMRVDIADVSDEYTVVGSNGPVDGLESSVEWIDPWPGITPGGASYSSVAEDHPGNDLDLRLHVCTDRGDVALVGRDAWEALRIEAWRPAFSDCDHKTLVGEIDILRTAVHLAKGCYRGQEAVARVHNLGQVPRRFVFLHLDGSEHAVVEPGDPILGPVRGAEREVGRVTSAAIHYELGPVALGLIKRTVPTDAPLAVLTDEGNTRVVANQEVIVGASKEAFSMQRNPALRKPPTS